ncbi:hypothetical protein C0992_003799 [Termitomyces sp. T32_za158]|nr:hypothetical protein C0992_003799 [Termitomyces sp. T32_za158]
MPTETSKPTSITKIRETSTAAPFAIDNEKESPPIHQPIQTPDKRDDPQIEAPEQAPPHQSSRVHIPTAKACPDNLPVTHLKLAVQESKAAGDQIRAAKVERCQNNSILPDEEQLDPRPTRVEEGNDHPIPDVANLASPEAIEHLLSIAETLDDPLMIDLSDEPWSWHKAMESPHAKEWEAGYLQDTKLEGKDQSSR